MTMKKTLQTGTPYHVAVVGVGASGTLVAAQFKRLAPHGRLALIGNSPRPARGVAYDTPYHANLLNVPAGNMSAFPDDMGHFVNWLKQHLPGGHAGTFAPRLLYGDYLTDIFDETVRDSETFDYVSDTVVGVTSQFDHWSVHMKSGHSIKAMSVVLAFGNLLVPSDPIDFNAVADRYWRNPWAADVTTGLDADAPILLVGTGLTMVDVALSLREVGHRGPIHAISRHGRLYQQHKPYQARPLPTLPADFQSPLGALRWIRREGQSAEKYNSDWRAVIDSLRPHTAAIWRGWTVSQRKSFLRHARNLWDIHRHRMAPEIAAQLSALMADNTLTIHRGRLASASPKETGVQVTWHESDTEILRKLDVVRIVNCTGPSRDYSQIQSPLISKLRSAGTLVADKLRLGFETDLAGRFVDANGHPVQGLFTLGPVRIPGLWESIAIPEIRNQALALAETLVVETVQSSIVA
ncbi:MAG: FAD/NAD(P)-binding protein [Chloroflexi bacterium]|nr:FAD/NAD(P)-binding protein [Chloroflexota bacterium]